MSKPWFNAKEALLKPSEQSLISVGSFFFNISSPSEAAKTFTVIVKVVKIIITIFLRKLFYKKWLLSVKCNWNNYWCDNNLSFSV